MGVINRELDPSQRRTTFEFYSAGLVATGVTGVVCMVPYPCSLDAMQLVAAGLSGAPTVQLIVNRFIPGSGLTVFNIGSTFALGAYGTSGAVSASLPAQGSTVTTLQASDVLMFQTGGTNAAVTSLGVELVIRPLNDITKYFGLV